jgi:aminobenzoyl-glutamate utilization protein B
VLAATMLDLFQNPTVVEDAWTYFREEQATEAVYEPFIGPGDPPAIEKNRETMAEFRNRLEAFYYDPSRYDTYLDQLGVDYPQLERPD